MHLVYRVEHSATRVGPFQTPDDYTQELGVMATAREGLLKAPGDDGLPLGHLPWCYVFGCLDVANLKKWFFLGDTPADNAAILRTLKAKGFVLAEYLVEADDCRISTSGIQVAFYPTDAEDAGLVQYHDLESLLDHAPATATVH